MGCTLQAIATGVYADVSNEAYHSGPGISKSGLDVIERSPAHYWERYLNPHRERRTPSAAMLTGSAMHSAILEPHKFETEYVVAPAVDRRTKDGRAQWEQFTSAHQGKTFIDKATHDICRRVRDSVQAHPAYDLLLGSPGAPEVSYFWERDGVLCKCRPDYLTASGWVLDVKSAHDARQRAFANALWEYRYYVQAPWYVDGVALASGVVPRGFIFIVIEKEPPYAVAMYAVDKKTMQHGRDAYERNLATYRHCMATGVWPAYPFEIMPISLPPWALKETARQLI